MTKWVSRLMPPVVLVACLFLMSGCTPYREQMVRNRIASEGAPAWVMGDFSEYEARHPDEVFFVGRGIGYNVLDEKGAYMMARHNVLEQIAEFVSAHVTEEIADRDEARGTRYLEGELDRQLIFRRVRNWKMKSQIEVQEHVGGATDRGIYWEQWDVEQYPELFTFYPIKYRGMRYKCWTLMSIPKKGVDQYVKLAADKIIASIEMEREATVTATATTTVDDDGECKTWEKSYKIGG